MGSCFTAIIIIIIIIMPGWAMLVCWFIYS